MDKDLKDKLEKIETDLKDLRNFTAQDVSPESQKKLRERIEGFKKRAETFKEKASAGKTAVEQYAKDHPWKAIGISMALGAVLSGVISLTRKK